MPTTQLTEQPSERNHAEIGMYHYFFADAILNSIPNGDNIGDIFGMGQDSFVMELYPLTEAFWLKVDSLYQSGHDFKGVIVYDLMDKVAECFWLSVVNCGGIPSVDDFVLELGNVVDDYCI